ncbi:MAG: DUF3298 domain-containing protein [Ignavibacteria bacterium]|nr:DUF3298 domain-containing protein [Ignavibacteria bacterium]
MKVFICIFILCFAFAKSGAQTINVTYKTISGSNPDMDYTISATYPQVDFGPDALMGVRGVASDINNSLDTTVDGIIKDFIKQVSEMPKKIVNGMGSKLEITSNGWVSNESLLSAELNTFCNIAGMAHPLTTVTTFNYSIISTGQLELSNLFLSNAEYLNYISAVCIKQLTDKALKEGYGNINDMILSGASADAKNFSEWTVKNDSLDIIFNVYQVMPYVMGIQTVSIPLSDMTNMIDPKGPLSFMYR